VLISVDTPTVGVTVDSTVTLMSDVIVVTMALKDIVVVVTLQPEGVAVNVRVP
jgi:hypothetical protein